MELEIIEKILREMKEQLNEEKPKCDESPRVDQAAQGHSAQSLSEISTKTTSPPPRVTSIGDTKEATEEPMMTAVSEAAHKKRRSEGDREEEIGRSSPNNEGLKDIPPPAATAPVATEDKKFDVYSRSPKANGGGEPSQDGAMKNERRAIKIEPSMIENEPPATQLGTCAVKDEPSPIFPLYAHQRSTSHFEWGMSLSGALQREERERKCSESSIFFKKAKNLKHEGDTAKTRVSKASKYLRSAAFFVLGSK